jgi:Dullard-like phosphatase family protein
MSEENKQENTNINNINNIDNEENNNQKKSNKRRRKELIECEYEESENIFNNNDFEIIQNTDIKEPYITQTSNNKEKDNNEKKYKTIEKNQPNNSPFKDNTVLQEKLKKIFLNRDKMKFQYTKQELPENLKYHSDDSDASDSPGLLKSKLLKKENNKEKENNLIVNISEVKSEQINKESIENNNEKKNLNEEKFKDIDNIKDENIISPIDINKVNEFDSPQISNIISKKNGYNSEKILESNNDKNKITSNLISKVEQRINDKTNENEDKNNIKNLNNNEETLKIEYNKKTEIKRNELINKIKLESIKDENHEKDINNKNYNRLTIKTSKNETENEEKIDKKEKIKDLFNIIEKLKEKKNESTKTKNNSKNKNSKLDIIKFPNKQINNIKKKNFKEKNDTNNNNNIIVPKKCINKDEIKMQKNYDESMNLLNKKNSENIPYNKQEEKVDKKIFNRNNIPSRKFSGKNRYKNSINDNNNTDIDLTTTPSSNLDKSFDAINNNQSKIIKKKNEPKIYRPKKANNIKGSKGKKIKEVNENNITKNNFIPNQNIIYNNFNNFFNSPGFYRKNNKTTTHKKNNSFSDYPIDDYNPSSIKEGNDNTIELYMNNQNVNNSFDGYMNQNLNIRNKSSNRNNYIFGVNINQPDIPKFKPINNIPICQINYNRNLGLNNIYRNENNNKSLGNIFTGVNNNIFDSNNYLNNEYLGNFSTKNNSINKQKFISYNILNSNPNYDSMPITSIANNQIFNNPNYNFNKYNKYDNIIYRNSNIIMSPQIGAVNKNINCIYNNKSTIPYQNTNIYNNSNDINMYINEPKTTKNTSINIEDLLVLQEKMEEIITALNKNGYIHYECFEFWNYYYNCSLFGKLEQLFKTKNDKKNVQIGIYHILISIMICYDYSYEINILKGDYSILEEILKLSNKILMIIYEHILSKVSSESKSNIWVFKLRNLLNNFNKSNNNDYFKISTQMSPVEKIIYYTSAIVQNIRVLLNYHKTKNFSYLTNIYKKISEQTYEEINSYFRDYILRVDNYNGSVLASVFLKENQNFKTEPAPYIHTKNSKRYSLILDLDETLVHFKISSESDNEGVLKIRPGVVPFLEKVGKFYELIIFTAATQEYGDLLIDAIEENNVYFEHRFYRQHTVIIENDFVKDLNRIGRPLDKIIIVDNMPQNFRLQKENGINIKAFWGEDIDDNALEELGIILINIAMDGGDVRRGIEKYKDDIIRKVTSNISKSNY